MEIKIGGLVIFRLVIVEAEGEIRRNPFSEPLVWSICYSVSFIVVVLWR